MRTAHSRHNSNDWHIKNANNLWKVYDRDQKYRCSFRTRAEAEQYIDQHRTRRPKLAPATIRLQPALLDA